MKDCLLTIHATDEGLSPAPDDLAALRDPVAERDHVCLHRVVDLNKLPAPALDDGDAVAHPGPKAVPSDGAGAVKVLFGAEAALDSYAVVAAWQESYRDGLCDGVFFHWLDRGSFC